MPRFTVSMSRRVVEYATVEVTAPDEAAAVEAALEGADTADWQTDFDAYGPVEDAAIIDGPHHDQNED